MDERTDRGLERRWVVIGEDGRYVTLGRASDPTPEEIGEAEAALEAQGLSGWLAVMQGNPYDGPAPILMEVRPLGGPARTFDSAARLCVSAIMARRTAV